MTDQPPINNVAVAKEVEHIKQFDPGLGSYNFHDLGQAVLFADKMSCAGPLLPMFLQRKPALCLAIVCRAVHWKFDPFALAAEAFQAKDGGMIGYSAKVFVAAMRSVAGIQLRYEFTGSFEKTGKPVSSLKGNVVAASGAVGDRACRAFIEIDGIEYDYITPTLDEITIKNSPLWHNDPDQQLSYYAGRGWARRHRPDVMMGAYSKEEVTEMSRELKDVTPKSGFAELAARARQEAADPHHSQTAEEAAPDAEVEEAEVEDEELDETFVQAGKEAAEAGFGRDQFPKDMTGDQARAWFQGHDAITEAAADA